jgi:hypothetical protein
MVEFSQLICGFSDGYTDMNELDVAAEKTYRAIGRFIFAFSQLEYTIREYLAEEIRLKEEHFSAVVESYDAARLCKVSLKVFEKTLMEKQFPLIKDLINKFFELNV